MLDILAMADEKLTKRQARWKAQREGVRARAFEANASHAATIPDALFDLLADDHCYLDIESAKHWPIEWVVGDDGQLGPDRELVLELGHGYCFGGDAGRHFVCIATLDDLTCAELDGISPCGCSDCAEDPYADAEYDDWKARQ